MGHNRTFMVIEIPYMTLIINLWFFHAMRETAGWYINIYWSTELFAVTIDTRQCPITRANWFVYLQWTQMRVEQLLLYSFTQWVTHGQMGEITVILTCINQITSSSTVTSSNKFNLHSGLSIQWSVKTWNYLLSIKSIMSIDKNIHITFVLHLKWANNDPHTV